MQSKAAKGDIGGRHVRWDGLCVPVRNEQAAVHGVDRAKCARGAVDVRVQGVDFYLERRRAVCGLRGGRESGESAAPAAAVSWRRRVVDTRYVS